MDSSSAVPLLTLAVNVGFSVVVCWYLLSKAIPEMQERFSIDLKTQREDSYAMLKAEREACMREREIAVASMERMLAITSKDGVDLLKRTAEDTRATYILLQDFIRTGGGKR